MNWFYVKNNFFKKNLICKFLRTWRESFQVYILNFVLFIIILKNKKKWCISNLIFGQFSFLDYSLVFIRKVNEFFIIHEKYLFLSESECRWCNFYFIFFWKGRGMQTFWITTIQLVFIDGFLEICEILRDIVLFIENSTFFAGIFAEIYCDRQSESMMKKSKEYFDFSFVELLVSDWLRIFLSNLLLRIMWRYAQYIYSFLWLFLCIRYNPTKKFSISNQKPHKFQ